MKKERPIGELVKNIIAGLESKGPTEEDVQETWRRAVGDTAAAHTRPVSFKKSSLTVNVDKSSWLYELTLKKKEILKKLESSFKGKRLREIRFRIGDINKGKARDEREKNEGA